MNANYVFICLILLTLFSLFKLENEQVRPTPTYKRKVDTDSGLDFGEKVGKVGIP